MYLHFTNRFIIKNLRCCADNTKWQIWVKETRKWVKLEHSEAIQSSESFSVDMLNQEIVFKKLEFDVVNFNIWKKILMK